MKRAIHWMAQNHVTANLLMLVLVVGGAIIGLSVKQEVFPEVLLDQVSIRVAYPGAGPDEVEEGIILPVEEGVSGVDGLKEIKSSATEGFGQILLTIEEGIDADRFLQDVKTEVDRIVTFPEEAEEPVITKLLNRREVASIVVYGEVSEKTLREQAEIIRDELLLLDGDSVDRYTLLPSWAKYFIEKAFTDPPSFLVKILFPLIGEEADITQIELTGVRPYEISIEISESKLREYGLSLEMVARRVREGSVDLPGGAIKTADGEILIRTKERRYHGMQYGDLAILTREDGTRLFLRDIATIRDGFQETDTYARFNGMPAAMVGVYRVGDQKPTVISDVIRHYVDERKQSLPESLHLDIWNDTSEIFESRMNLLLRNALFGLVLVFAVLSLFLQTSLALWVMLGIPISFLGAMLLLPFFDVSINMISLFAFIMALGIVVDDAIVVGENIHENRQEGKSFLQAAKDGACEVGAPVVYSVLTTIAAFLPLVFVQGSLGKFIKVIPLVVIAILIISLVESLFVLPAHLSNGGRKKPKSRRGRLGFRDRFQTLLNWVIEIPYARFLLLNLEFRYAFVAFSVFLLLVAIGLLRGGIVKFRFMPEVDGDLIRAELSLHPGAPVEKTGEIAQFLGDKALEVVRQYDEERGAAASSVRQLFTIVGGTIAQGGPIGISSSSASHVANIALLLIPSEDRGYPASEIAGRWRQAVGAIPGVDSLTFTSNLMRLGANIDVRLAHESFTPLTAAASRLKASLAQYPGVGDIADNYPPGKGELKVRLRPAAGTLGITEEDLGRQLRSGFYGAEALRLLRGRNEVRVMVRYPYEDRRRVEQFETMRIRTPEGGEIPLLDAARVEWGKGYSEINRADRKRVINVTASVDSTVANAEEILADLKGTVLRELTRDYPGLSFDLEGEEKERRESLGSMGKGFLLALLAIYALLAIPFASYSQPFLIMAAIPFGMVGAILGHLIMGLNLSMLSLFGTVALSGVVVNDSLLLIARANEGRKTDLSPHAAIAEAAKRRFRPIILTSLTTFFGLAPMIAEKSVQAQFLIPMAISLGFGILFATGITLLLVPCLYLILEDLRRMVGLGKIDTSGAGY